MQGGGYALALLFLIRNLFAAQSVCPFWLTSDMESLNLNNLASSLQASSSYANAEKELTNNFRGLSMPPLDSRASSHIPASESIPPLMIGGSLTTNRYPSHKAGGLFEDPIKSCLRQSAITDFHVFQLLRSALRRYIARPRQHPSERTTPDIPLPAMTSSI